MLRPGRGFRSLPPRDGVCERAGTILSQIFAMNPQGGIWSFRDQVYIPGPLQPDRPVSWRRYSGHTFAMCAVYVVLFALPWISCSTLQLRSAIYALSRHAKSAQPSIRCCWGLWEHVLAENWGRSPSRLRGRRYVPPDYALFHLYYIQFIALD